ncbi:MAG: protease complex subunit PrcB family protein [Elusimicrobia bacterium]|nr:protease complex subunit PrcB family protein [Elusimicrobiota bacterium]
MTNKTLAAAILLAAATAASAMGRRPPKTSGSGDAPAEDKMTILEWKGQQGGPQIHGHQIVYDADAWDAGWRELGQAAPALDFARYAAVFVYVGQRPTGGFKVAFEDPIAQGDDLLVRYRILKPDGMVTQAITHPWHVRAFPRPKGRVIVEYLVR